MYFNRVTGLVELRQYTLFVGGNISSPRFRSLSQQNHVNKRNSNN